MINVSAIHINYRSWLRSSSTHEPSDPPLRIVRFLAILHEDAIEIDDLVEFGCWRHSNQWSLGLTSARTLYNPQGITRTG